MPDDRKVTAAPFRDDDFEGIEWRLGIVRIQLTDQEAFDSVVALKKALGAPEDCTGEGKCHGALSWCDACGDVSQVCDAAEGDCHCHARCEHCGRLHSIDYECDEMRKRPVRNGTHYDAIPHGNCNDSLWCDCACEGCLREWIKAGRPGRLKVEGCNHPEWTQETKICTVCGVSAEVLADLGPIESVTVNGVELPIVKRED